MTPLPHVFCIDMGVWKALSEEEVAATVVGMREMGIYNLPFDGKIILRIIHAPGFYMEVTGLREEEQFIWDWVIVALKGEREPEFTLSVGKIGDSTSSEDHPQAAFEKLRPTSAGNKMLYRYRKLAVRADDQRSWRDGLIAILASKGLEKKTKQPSKLKSLGIGRDRSDQYTTTIRLSPSLETGNHEEARPGKPVRPHLRRGHARDQRHGPRNELVKRIWIDPVFVNADEGFISTRTAYRVVH